MMDTGDALRAGGQPAKNLSLKAANLSICAAILALAAAANDSDAWHQRFPKNKASVDSAGIMPTEGDSH
jgi:hypothetical protein